jgi:hypothetical protein
MKNAGEKASMKFKEIKVIKATGSGPEPVLVKVSCEVSSETRG